MSALKLKKQIKYDPWCYFNPETDEPLNMNIQFAQHPMLPSVRDMMKLFIHRMIEDRQIATNDPTSCFTNYLENFITAADDYDVDEPEGLPIFCPLCRTKLEHGPYVKFPVSKRLVLTVDVGMLSHMIEHEILIHPALGTKIFELYFANAPRKRQLIEYSKDELLDVITELATSRKELTIANAAMERNLVELTHTNEGLHNMIVELQNATGDEEEEYEEDDEEDGDDEELPIEEDNIGNEILKP